VLVRRHRQVFEDLRTRHPEGAQALRTRYRLSDRDIVTLASIVEKETGQAAERLRVASVYLNRLSFPNMPHRRLQADPTIGINVVFNTPVTDSLLSELGSYGKVRDVIAPINAVTMLAKESQREVNDRCDRIAGNGTCRHFKAEKLPIETAGSLLVFRTYARMSYALVLDETAPIHIGDHVTSP
jgi:hypothetical protein